MKRISLQKKKWISFFWYETLVIVRICLLANKQMHNIIRKSFCNLISDYTKQNNEYGLLQTISRLSNNSNTLGQIYKLKDNNASYSNDVCNSGCM